MKGRPSEAQVVGRLFGRVLGEQTQSTGRGGRGRRAKEDERGEKEGSE